MTFITLELGNIVANSNGLLPVFWCTLIWNRKNIVKVFICYIHFNDTPLSLDVVRASLTAADQFKNFLTFYGRKTSIHFQKNQMSCIFSSQLRNTWKCIQFYRYNINQGSDCYCTDVTLTLDPLPRKIFPRKGLNKTGNAGRISCNYFY